MEAEEVLEQARQQLAAAGSRRRRGRGGRGGTAAAADAQYGNGDMPALVEITPLPELSEPETVVTVSVPTTASIAPPEVEIPARRGRTRSSAAKTPAANTQTSQATIPQAGPPPADTAVAVAEPELDESGEPRRRRRRSSASS